MRRWSLRQKLADINRLRAILTIVLEAGGGALIHRLRLRYLIPLQYRIPFFLRRPPPEERLATMERDRPVLNPPMMRSVLERLGPTFIKLGQILSMRADLIGPVWSGEFSKLQEDAPPVPYEDVRSIVEEELGSPPEALFKSFEAKPVAAASLAQVHRAYLPDGQEVAVKVQRPGIRRTIEQDIDILFELARLAERLAPEYRIYQPVRIVEEFSEWTLRELDFSVEGRSAERLRYILRDDPRILIPRVYWDFTSNRVLTTEFSHGVRVDDLGRMAALGLDRKALAAAGIDAFFRECLIEGFFHADPHPGNFFAMADGRLCFHDFGMVGYLNGTTRRELLGCMIAFVNKNSEAYLRHVLHLAEFDEKSNVDRFRREVSDILSEFFFVAHPPSAAWAFFRVINRGGRNGIRFPADLALFGKAILTAEAMGRTLHPDFDLNRELEPFVKKAVKAYMSPRRGLESIENEFFDTVGQVTSLPERVTNVLAKLEQGTIGVKLDSTDLQGIKREFDRQNDLRILGIVLTAVVLSTIGLLYLEGRNTLLGFPLSSLGIIISIGLFIWFLIVLKQGPRGE
ncbi:MAG TPA: AarF/ABC1/UbiB kinase family protein [Nitrospiria bacterium]|nr:AarF/ABC1/UbiB kinase family protein [Nitrospiria bacterium]